ncbi:hypothetical protein DFQ28_003849 [Apophysomyces sp. BC1034]|nr:hypothetical protein DFQ30_002865 [Apophysomyces sp. BC1015]KAG0182183.1 hypothetical protein DFQ29_005399 [Apophysomyces sp. BC1021]KAG0193676.1 hypothetical protein DFQ28_003849 [Apophysomyces sp. BC1034]
MTQLAENSKVVLETEQDLTPTNNKPTTIIHTMDEEDEGEDDDDDSDSSMDDAVTIQRPNPQPLFLNFTSDLSPQKGKKKPKKQTAYRVNGVNILNRKELDSKTAIERLKKRRENHNHVERRRRDIINNTILELSHVVPNATQPGQKPNKGSILKLALDHIQALQEENKLLRERLATPSQKTSPALTTPFTQSSDQAPMHRGTTPPTSTTTTHLSCSSPSTKLRPILPAKPSQFHATDDGDQSYGNACRYYTL